MRRGRRESAQAVGTDDIWAPAADLMSGLLLIFVFLVVATIIKNNEDVAALAAVNIELNETTEAMHAARREAYSLGEWRDLVESVLSEDERASGDDTEIRRVVRDRLDHLMQRDQDAREVVIQLASARLNMALMTERHHALEQEIAANTSELTRLRGMLGSDATYSDTRASIEARIDALAGEFGAGELRRAPGVLPISAELLFGTNESELTPAGQAELERIIPSVATALLSQPADAAIVHRIIVEGHASCRGGSLHNMRLSVLRAQAVYRHIRGSMTDLPHREAFFVRLAPTGRGSIECNTSADDDARDRRVDIRVEFNPPSAQGGEPAVTPPVRSRP